MEIRHATTADAPEIHSVMLAAFTPFRDQYTAGCFDATVLDPPRIADRMRDGPVFVVESDGEIVATVACVLDDRGAYVRGMAVHPDVRRNGLGRTLLDACVQYAQDNGATTLWLSTTLFLAGSIALYQAYGFHDADGPADLHGTPLRSFEMATP